ncbi:MAG: hypothetical protein K2X82_26485 [Gemmataceae bacterium]|nr:hypothetical protein [Gemmataceae bacterium]
MISRLFRGRSTPRATRRATAPRVTLRFELLEWREVPATIRWTGGGMTSLWGDTGNWNPMWVPGVGDAVILDGLGGGNAATKDVAVVNEAPTLTSLTATPGYTGKIRIYTGTSITVDSLTADGVRFSRGTTDTGAGGTLVIRGTGSTLKASEFDRASLSIDATAPATATATINSTVKLLNGAQLLVGPRGELTWQAGDIEMTGSALVKNNGVLRIHSSGRLGGAQAEPANGLINSNSLSITSSPVFDRAFTNNALFVVEPGAGPRFKGRADQNSGTTELRSGTIYLDEAGAMRYIAWSGAVVGTGTIDGNLWMGSSANEAVTLSPGSGPGADRIGTITITQDLLMRSANAVMSIQVTDTGGIDKVDAGRATLAGTLSIDMPLETAPGPMQGKPKYRPARGTKLHFLTATTFVNDFATRLPAAGWSAWMNPRNGIDDWEIKKGNTSYFLEVTGSGPA